MKIEGRAELEGSPDAAFALLIAEDTLRTCLPGCEALAAEGPHCFRATLAVALGPLRGRFNAGITLADLRPPEALRMAIDASGIPGRVAGEAGIRLESHAGNTVVSWTGDVRPTGLLAALGQRLLAAGADRLIGEYFVAVRARQRPSP